MLSEEKRFSEAGAMPGLFGMNGGDDEARGRNAPYISLDHNDRARAGAGAFAQDNGSHGWQECASITRAKQADWVTPLITPSANST
jgi:hypothetical protein